VLQLREILNQIWSKTHLFSKKKLFLLVAYYLCYSNSIVALMSLKKSMPEIRLITSTEYKGQVIAYLLK